MFPIGDDDTSRRTTPVVTYALIALNLLFFFVELSGGDPFIQQWSVVPRRLLANPAADFPTIFTSMFMHAGWLHLGGNMLYLWIFGDNVEDSFGHVKFLVFYLLCGIAATAAQLAFSVGSSVPNLGASGAIAGVLGRYILLFPSGQVQSPDGQRRHPDAGIMSSVYGSCCNSLVELDRLATLQIPVASPIWRTSVGSSRDLC